MHDVIASNSPTKNSFYSSPQGYAKVTCVKAGTELHVWGTDSGVVACQDTQVSEGRGRFGLHRIDMGHEREGWEGWIEMEALHWRGEEYYRES